jgi:hypothetical protein
MANQGGRDGRVGVLHEQQHLTCSILRITLFLALPNMSAQCGVYVNVTNV